MKIEVTDLRNDRDDSFVATQLSAYNATFTVTPFSIHSVFRHSVSIKSSAIRSSVGLRSSAANMNGITCIKDSMTCTGSACPGVALKAHATLERWAEGPLSCGSSVLKRSACDGTSDAPHPELSLSRQ
jgi:hypothetical protein